MVGEDMMRFKLKSPTPFFHSAQLQLSLFNMPGSLLVTTVLVGAMFLSSLGVLAQNSLCLFQDVFAQGSNCQGNPVRSLLYTGKCAPGHLQ
jgi:hypothetical protein